MEDSRHSLSFRHGRRLVSVLACTIAALSLEARGATGGEPESRAADFARFQEAVSSAREADALSLGEKLLADLRRKYRMDKSFETYEARLKAAEFLAGRMRQELNRVTNLQASALTEGMVNRGIANPSPNAPSIAPARRFYETSTRLFSLPVSTDKFTGAERTFLSSYYDLRLRLLTSAVAQAGQALVVAQPGFAGTHDYVLVLPLLHASESRPVDVRVLPAWMQQPEQLDILSESCLLQFELLFQAMTIAKRSAELQGQEFSPREYFRSVAERCQKSHPRIAAECLRHAIDSGTKDPDVAVALHLQIIQLWTESQDYALAAGEARKVFETYPDHRDAGKAIWLYYSALVSAANFDAVLTGIDNALKDPRCESFRGGLLYFKWVALKRKGGQAAQVTVLESELFKQYGNSPLIAPVMLSQAVDLLASQAYGEAYEILGRLVEKFPHTEAAGQARKMLQRLKGTKTKS